MALLRSSYGHHARAAGFVQARVGQWQIKDGGRADHEEVDELR